MTAAHEVSAAKESISEKESIINFETFEKTFEYRFNTLRSAVLQMHRAVDGPQSNMPFNMLNIF